MEQWFSLGHTSESPGEPAKNIDGCSQPLQFQIDSVLLMWGLEFVFLPGSRMLLMVLVLGPHLRTAVLEEGSAVDPPGLQLGYSLLPTPTAKPPLQLFPVGKMLPINAIWCVDSAQIV